MWRNIRGLGYAYAYSINPRPNEALLSLHFYRSVNVPAAYKETKSILVCLTNKILVRLSKTMF